MADFVNNVITNANGKDKVIATVLADRAERYFSTALI